MLRMTKSEEKRLTESLEQALLVVGLSGSSGPS